MKSQIIYLVWPTPAALILAAGICREESETISKVIETGQRSLVTALEKVCMHPKAVIRIFLPEDADYPKGDIQQYEDAIDQSNSQVKWYTVKNEPPPDSIKKYLTYKITLAFFGNSSETIASEQLKEAIENLSVNPDEIPVKELHSLRTFIKMNNPAIEGQSSRMIILKKDIRRVAQAGLENILLIGETGSGKEAAAFFLHNLDPCRREQEFHALNCAGLQEDFLASELFGHVEGAYTGANKNRTGLIKKLDNGTLFLDELPDMPLRIQAMLLRFLESGEYSPMGSNKTFFANVKIIAGGQREMLAEKITSKLFRKDLYYRLAGKIIIIPCLREIAEDLPVLIDHLVYKMCDHRKRRNDTIAYFKARMTEFQEYHWPGNVRELANYVKRKLRLGKDEEIILGEEDIAHLIGQLDLPISSEPKLHEHPKVDRSYPYAVKPSFDWLDELPNSQELKQANLRLATPKEVSAMYGRFIYKSLTEIGVSQALTARKLQVSVNTLKAYINAG